LRLAQLTRLRRNGRQTSQRRGRATTVPLATVPLAIVRLTPVFLATCFAAVCFAAPPASSRGSAAVVDYLYIESNEGNSSGGHVALRLDDRVYDFQHHHPGVVRLDRRHAGDFLYSYAYLQNRPMHVSRLSVSDETAALLRDHFNGIYLAQRAQFDALAVLAEDRRLLTAFAGATDPTRTETIELPGTGYFFAGRPRSPFLEPSEPSKPSDPSPALLALRDRAQGRLGRDWIQRRIDAERDALDSMQPVVTRSDKLTTEPGAWPNVETAFSLRYRDRRSAIAALEVLRDATATRADATIRGLGPEFDLTPEQVAALRAFGARLEGDLLGLLTSKRQDWGFAMLVGMARLDVLEQSIRSGSLVVLDAFPHDAANVPYDALDASEALPLLIADSAADVEQARSALSAAPVVAPAATPLATSVHTPATRVMPGADEALDEASYGHLETSLNRYHELRNSREHRSDLRIATDPMLPARSAAFPLDVIPQQPHARFAAAAAAAAVVERNYGDALHARLAYNLTGRNCVSELLDTIDDAMGDDDTSAALLGGTIDKAGPERIIPFVSADAVNSNYRVEARFVLPSWREQRMAQSIAAGESTAMVSLRESNTLTSSIYRPAPEDSYFVLFADHAAVRPLAGAVNLVAATAATAAGIATLPLRGIEPLRMGIRGMLFSLPELAFVRIRRGSFVYVERKAARLPSWW